MLTITNTRYYNIDPKTVIYENQPFYVVIKCISVNVGLIIF